MLPRDKFVIFMKLNKTCRKTLFRKYFKSRVRDIPTFIGVHHHLGPVLHLPPLRHAHHVRCLQPGQAVMYMVKHKENFYILFLFVSFLCIIMMIIKKVVVTWKPENQYCIKNVVFWFGYIF